MPTYTLFESGNKTYLLHPHHIRKSINGNGQCDSELQMQYFTQLCNNDAAKVCGYQLTNNRKVRSDLADAGKLHFILHSSKFTVEGGDKRWTDLKARYDKWRKKTLKVYESETDFYLIKAFGCCADKNADGKIIAVQPENYARDHQLRKNPFPHPMHTTDIEHYCMWYHPKIWKFNKEMTEQMERRINEDIIKALNSNEEYKHSDYTYFWFVNSTPSMKEIFHVHVYIPCTKEITQPQNKGRSIKINDFFKNKDDESNGYDSFDDE